MKSTDRFLVIGQGSMGKRRVRCLLANAITPDQITVFDTREDRLQEAIDKYAVKTTRDVEIVLRDRDVIGVFVSVPGFLHMEYCLAAARAGKHWFCEVPLSLDLDGVAELKSLTRSQSLVGAPGCQLLFHPLGRALREWSEGALGGPILAASYAYGTYLPEWHPYEDYRKFYASNKALGGGNLDVIAQELVWIRWIVGRRILAATCRTSKTSGLELAAGTPDQQGIILEFEGGLMFSMHFDIVDRTHERLARFATEHSTVKWSNLEPALQIYDAAKKEWQRVPEPEGYQYETCYQEEVGTFLRCIENGEPWPIAIETAEEIIRVLLALDRSDQSKGRVALSEVPG